MSYRQLLHAALLCSVALPIFGCTLQAEPKAEKALTDAATFRLRLVTSDRDYFRGAVLGLHLALKADGIEHEHLVIPGPHDYAFNRGPGGVEMLLWHDRVLRGEPPL